MKFLLLPASDDADAARARISACPHCPNFGNTRDANNCFA
jgi:hypothetical protein